MMTTHLTASGSAPDARRRRAQRGSTLIEAMVAGAVFATGLLGLLAAQTMGAKQNWMASKEARATAIALDVANSVRRWPYPSAADTTLQNDPSNDGAAAPSLVSGAITTLPDSTKFEHDINAPVARAIPPLASAAIDFNQDGNPDFMRLLHVEPLNGNGESGITVSVVVAWTEAVGARQVVIPVVKYDPAQNLATIPGI